ncbi:MAG: hypothetical protein WDA53_06395 [Bacillota bacterium]
MKSLRRKVFLIVFAVIFAFFLVAGCGNKDPKPPVVGEPQGQQEVAQGEEPAQEIAEPMVFVSSGDKSGCLDCHSKISDDKDYSLATSLAYIEEHTGEALEGINDCIKCHTSDAQFSIQRILHSAHYSGGPENHFVSSYEGSCVHCHKLEQNGRLTVAGLEEPGTEFVSISVASIDKAPNGCTDCHKKISDEQDYSLKATVAKIEGHSRVYEESVTECQQCHGEGTSKALSRKLHNAHLLGEHYQEYGNSCLNCHDQSNKMKLKGS